MSDEETVVRALLEIREAFGEFHDVFTREHDRFNPEDTLAALLELEPSLYDLLDYPSGNLDRFLAIVRNLGVRLLEYNSRAARSDAVVDNAYLFEALASYLLRDVAPYLERCGMDPSECRRLGHFFSDTTSATWAWVTDHPCRFLSDY